MRINTYIIGFSVLLVFACGGLGWWVYELNNQLAASANRAAAAESEKSNMAGTIDELRGELEERAEKAVSLAGELAATKSQVKQLESEKSEVEKAQEKLEEEMQKALAEQEVTISRLQGKLTLNILDRVMFDSGKAELKPQGQELLLKVAEVLKTVPDRQILIVGHTDNIPVTASRHLFASNWELSALRATSAVRYLCETAGVDPRNLGAMGYGEHHPIADNASREGRAQNRRIEVVIMDSGVLLPGEEKK